MSPAGLFAMGVLVTLLYGAGLSLLVYGAILDGRDEARTDDLAVQPDGAGAALALLAAVLRAGQAEPFAQRAEQAPVRFGLHAPPCAVHHQVD